MEDVNEFLTAPEVLFDVRSPAEYMQGHIPGAKNLPLFSNSERAAVGTEYKKVGQKQAIELGLKIVGAKLPELFTTVSKEALNGVVKIYCWRGGMRSGSVGSLLRSLGMSVRNLKGGYKSFRRWTLGILNETKRINVVGGFTGTGKTDVLQSLREEGEQILDLEALACHRGSCYGVMGISQPSNEHFENSIAIQWMRFSPGRPVWLEDESRLIGNCCIPKGIYEQMKRAPLFLIERSLKERLEILLRDYGSVDPQELITATIKLSKRLGGLRTEEIVNLISNKKTDAAMTLVLQYYDKAYTHSLKQKPLQCINVEGLSSASIAKLLVREKNNEN